MALIGCAAYAQPKKTEIIADYFIHTLNSIEPKLYNQWKALTLEKIKVGWVL